MNVVKYGILVLLIAVSHTASAVTFWGKVKNVLNDCKYAEEEYKETFMFEIQNTPMLPNHFTGTFSIEDFNAKPWMRDFRYVIVINKAQFGVTAQTMRIFEYGHLIKETKISTGREIFELRRKNKVCAGAPLNSYWSQTPTGFYTPKYLSKDHTSSSWDADMPFAVFFDVDNGLALHQAHKNYLGNLGKRASGGCVRQDEATAQEVFARIEETEGATVPEVNLDGTPILNEQGQVSYISKQTVISAKTGKAMKFFTYSALIIVEEVVE